MEVPLFTVFKKMYPSISSQTPNHKTKYAVLSKRKMSPPPLRPSEAPHL